MVTSCEEYLQLQLEEQTVQQDDSVPAEEMVESGNSAGDTAVPMRRSVSMLPLTEPKQRKRGFMDRCVNKVRSLIAGK